MKHKSEPRSYWLRRHQETYPLSHVRILRDDNLEPPMTWHDGGKIKIVRQPQRTTMVEADSVVTSVRGSFFSKRPDEMSSKRRK